jgi:type IV pilus assembly protein PilB
MADKRQLLGEALVKQGVLTPGQLQEALEEQQRTGRHLGEILVKRGMVTEAQVAEALAEQLGMTYVDLATFTINPAAIRLVPRALAARWQILPLFKIGDNLTIAMANPLDVAAIDALARATKLNVQPAIAAPSAIRQALEQHYGAVPVQAPASSKAAAKGAEAPSAHPRSLPGAVGDAEGDPSVELASAAPVIALIQRVLEDALASRASDVHLEPQEGQFLCRYRVDGVLQMPQVLPAQLQLGAVSRIKIMAEMNIAERRLPQDGRIAWAHGGRAVDLRVATFPTLFGEHVAIRLLDKSTGLLKLEQIGLGEPLLAALRQVLARPYGIVLVTGPTGSGKTTTLYAMLQQINDAKRNILTLEDPVEYTIPGIHQAQVNVKAGLTFANGLRAMLRLDPDIIMIGEIRDRETAEIAIQSALTGHLVFSTLHTNDAASACSRLTDIGVEPYLIASSLTAVIAQRLVRTVCAGCRQTAPASAEEARLLQELGGREGQPLARAPGCAQCHQTGYKGRSGIYELLQPNDFLKTLIVEKAPANRLREEAQRAGLRTLRQDGLAKVVAGTTTLAEVLRVTGEV